MKGRVWCCALFCVLVGMVVLSGSQQTRAASDLVDGGPEYVGPLDRIQLLCTEGMNTGGMAAKGPGVLSPQQKALLAGVRLVPGDGLSGGPLPAGAIVALGPKKLYLQGKLFPAWTRFWAPAKEPPKRPAAVMAPVMKAPAAAMSARRGMATAEAFAQ